jgi:hypothetical protein
VRVPRAGAKGEERTMRLKVALKVGKVRTVAETRTPQLPAPPPRRA